MFCCRAFSRTLTCFLLYTLSTRWSVTIIPFVRFYFEFSEATDNVFLCSRYPFCSPLTFVSWCGIMKRSKVWIVSNSSLKVLFYFHLQMTKALKNIRNALTMDMNQSFFSASFSSYTFFPEKGKLPVYAPPCVEVKTWILISDPYRFYALSVLTVSSVSVYWCSKENMIYAVHCSLLKH